MSYLEEEGKKREGRIIIENITESLKESELSSQLYKIFKSRNESIQ